MSGEKRWFHYPTDDQVIRQYPPFIRIDEDIEVEVHPLGTAVELASLRRLRDELVNIRDATPETWTDFEPHERIVQFRRWAQNRARDALKGETP
jgi:hypothetical protein